MTVFIHIATPAGALSASRGSRDAASGRRRLEHQDYAFCSFCDTDRDLFNCPEAATGHPTAGASELFMHKKGGKLAMGQH